MSNPQTALLAMHGLFAGAFILGFFFPLAFAGSEERELRTKEMKETNSRWSCLGPLLDLWLILEDAIPIFWLVQMIFNSPGNARAARNKWRAESSIRMCFWVALILTAALPLHLLPWV